MVDAIVNFGPEFKPPSMHELRTWILKEEMNDINILMEEYKKSLEAIWMFNYVR